MRATSFPGAIVELFDQFQLRTVLGDDSRRRLRGRVTAHSLDKAEQETLLVEDPFHRDAPRTSGENVADLDREGVRKRKKICDLGSVGGHPVGRAMDANAASSQ